MNTFGRIYRLTTFGESHGKALGGVIDGAPAGVTLDMDEVQHELLRRRPGQSVLTSQRQEQDKVEFLSGIFEGKTTGTPIGFVVENSDCRSSDYSQLENAYRPSHADYTYTAKYGLRDYRGGGRASARETVSRVVGGAVAKQILTLYGIRIAAFTSRVGGIKIPYNYTELDLSNIDVSPVRCPHQPTSLAMEKLIDEVKQDGDTIGGVITCVITGMKPGLGNPVFGKLNALLAEAVMSIPAAKGVEFGMGFEGACCRGSQMNDKFVCQDGVVHTLTNNSGGVQGGISNGEDIVMRVAFKPVATLMRPMETIDTCGNNIVLSPKGRHDTCVLPRAVPVVEAMVAMTILDSLLLSKVVRV